MNTFERGWLAACISGPDYKWKILPRVSDKIPVLKEGRRNMRRCGERVTSRFTRSLSPVRLDEAFFGRFCDRFIWIFSFLPIQRFVGERVERLRKPCWAMSCARG